MTTPTDDEFRTEVRGWLTANLGDDRGGGVAWNQHLAANGWTCIGWPVEHGGRGLSLAQQVIFHEEYARPGPRTGQPPRRGAARTDAHRPRHGRSTGALPAADQGGDRAVVPGLLRARRRLRPRRTCSTKARLVGGRVDHRRAEGLDLQRARRRLDLPPGPHRAGLRRHHGLSFLLVPLDQDGVEVRPIEQLTGESEFNEVFFTGARTSADLVVGEPGQGWAVAMALLGFERGVSTLGQQVGFERELADLVTLARGNGTFDDPVLRDRLARGEGRTAVMKANVVRTLVDHREHRGRGVDRQARLGATGTASSASWRWTIAGPAATWSHRAVDSTDWQRLFLFSRADTIYGGSDEIQRNILAERVLGLPREPRPGEPRG